MESLTGNREKLEDKGLDQSHKFYDVPILYHTMHHLEQKYASGNMGMVHCGISGFGVLL